jgi:pimeloyl-ACP methyl ester carboxylesterase
MRDAISKSGDLTLSDEERLRHLKHAFFAPANDASVWLTGWYPEVKKAQRAATDSTPQAEWWSAGNVPILDVQPENDVMIPSESALRYREELGERVSIACIPSAGHALLPEQPEAVALALLGFLKELSARP